MEGTNDGPSKWKIIGISVLGLVLLLSVSFVLTTFGLEWERYFGKYERSVERDVYEENKSYVDSKLDTLSDRWLEYKRASGKDKSSICQAVMMEFQDFDADKVKNDGLRRWLLEIQSQGCQ